MRYRIGENPDRISPALDQGAFLSLALLSLLISIGFILAGMRSRHYWMAIWGAGLLISSLVYIIYVMVIL